MSISMPTPDRDSDSDREPNPNPDAAPIPASRPAPFSLNLIMLPKIPRLVRPIYCEGRHFAPPVAATRMAWRDGIESRPDRYIGVCEEHARRERCAQCGVSGALKDELGRCLVRLECERRPHRRRGR